MYQRIYPWPMYLLYIIRCGTIIAIALERVKGTIPRLFLRLLKLFAVMLHSCKVANIATNTDNQNDISPSKDKKMYDPMGETICGLLWGERHNKLVWPAGAHIIIARRHVVIAYVIDTD